MTLHAGILIPRRMRIGDGPSQIERIKTQFSGE